MLDTLTVVRSTKDVDYHELAQLLSASNLADHPPELRRKAFDNSQVVVFCYDTEGRMIGCGRALSDGAYEAALYDVAVVEELRGQGLGRFIVETILEDLAGQNVIFFTAVGKEAFYEKLGCHRMNTGMARFARPERMRERGYID
ncbi:MAG: GNAT family N-acetyltransferase [Coriobacteriales bacterium]|jgi:predicted N-acetyltransferase YhbS|nr:GNAT family N-acetyltransferase [Coriobacteriales bacterium]